MSEPGKQFKEEFGEKKSTEYAKGETTQTITEPAQAVTVDKPNISPQRVLVTGSRKIQGNYKEISNLAKHLRQNNG